MCLKPILIKNVNYGSTSRLSHIKDSTAQFIQVPCGRCSVCLTLKQQYITQRVQMESLSHDLYFLTLTYCDEMLPKATFGDITFSYVDLNDWQSMLKMIRKHEDLPDFKYFMVTEYGGKRHRPHIHAILSFPKDDKQTLADRWSFELKLHSIFLKYWRRNVNLTDKFTTKGKRKVNTRSPVWKPLCHYVRKRNKTNFELHYLDPWSSKNGLDDVAFYASKYCLKYDTWLDKFKSKLYFSLSESDFTKAWDLLRPRRLLSKGFGSPYDPKVITHINKGIKLSLDDLTALFPYFISPVQGNTFPLAPYYSSIFLKVKDLEVFNSRKPILTDSDAMLDTTPELTVNEILTKEYNFSLVRTYLDSQHTFFDDEADFTNDFLITSTDEKISSFDNDVFINDDF